tara:strand:- start:6548 stop:7306 length:759 start_codon:yes stop_codon:yes gene_type:complete
MKKIIVSGGFDPLHIGHLRMFQEARKLGDYLIVIVNSDDFLLKKKGFIFMPSQERKEIIEGLSCVDEVVDAIDKDHTVSQTIASICKDNHTYLFANGGDRAKPDSIPESDICDKNNVQLIFNIGGEKIQSSSDLLKPFINTVEQKPWGYYEVYSEEKNYLVKKMVLSEGKLISLQSHNHRNEIWTIAQGEGKFTISDKEIIGEKGSTFKIDKKEIHRIENIGKGNLVVIETQIGDQISEEDIIRWQDEYGRA